MQHIGNWALDAEKFQKLIQVKILRSLGIHGPDRLLQVVIPSIYMSLFSYGVLVKHFQIMAFEQLVTQKLSIGKEVTELRALLKYVFKYSYDSLFDQEVIAVQ